MSRYLRPGAVNDVGHMDVTDPPYQEDGEGSVPQELYPVQSYPGCFGLPYQDHNYGAPRPPTPPPSPPPPPQQMLMPPLAPLTPDKASAHIEVDDVGTTAALPITPPEVAPQKEMAVEDDSITRCICDFIHDDGYMICCDRCSVWQHIDCMGVDRNNIPDLYFCELCEPRPLDKERARLIQLKKKEFLDTLTDSSATDTDPEEEINRQLSQQQHGVDEGGIKKLKSKKQRTRSGNNNSNISKVESKQRKPRKDKKDIKKEKENKDSSKKIQQKPLSKESPPVFKSNKKIKLEKNKKPGLSLMNSDNTQDPWDSSYSPWVDKYEEAHENSYSTDILNLFVSQKINGIHTPDSNSLNGKLRVQLCHVTEVNKNRKGLEATETIGMGEAVVEYTGKVMFKHQFDRENFFKQLNPFVLFYSKYDNMDMCIDATSYGNIARFIRRSCKANAEVRHVVENGHVNFFVFSTKVIPRGSEITIPYDYNYKDCIYCVECACLRNNCPVAKYFKKRRNSTVKKEKSPQKLPKSPVKSPIKLQIKSPVKLQQEEETPDHVIMKHVKAEVETTTQPKEEPPKMMTRATSSDPHDRSVECTTVVKPVSDNSSDNEDTTQSSATETGQHKMTREERKMDAIMKAFEKLEKRQERRKEALSRLDRKSVDVKKDEKNEKNEKPPIKKEEKISKPKDRERETRQRRREEEVLVPEQKEEAFSVAVETIEPIKEEPKVDITPVEPVVKEIKPRNKARKAKRVSSRRRNRAGSGSNAVSEPSLSVDAADERSNSLPSALASSCPNTPLITNDVSDTPPSFKFLKTKKHLMNEWLHEKNNDGLPNMSSSPAKTEPLVVDVEEDTMFVTCLPSPRNAMEHLRRNSHSSGSSLRPANNVMENSIGSAKKRWLRQAMWEKPKMESEGTSPVTSSAGIASPSMHSPGASPPGDFVTPLKKRRMARESVDVPLTSSPSVTPVPSLSVSEDSSDVPTTEEEIKPFSPVYTPSVKMEIPKKRGFVSPRDLRKSSIRDSMDSEVSESTAAASTRTSVDVSSDSEQEKVASEQDTVSCPQENVTCLQKVSDTGSNENIHSELVSMEDRTSGIDHSLLSDTSNTCEVTNSSEEEHRVVHTEPDMNLDSTSDNLTSEHVTNQQMSEVSADVSSVDQNNIDMESESEVEVEDKEVSTEMDFDSMEVDSTEDRMLQEKVTARQSICDSTSKAEETFVHSGVSPAQQGVSSASDSNVDVLSCVDSSTDMTEQVLNNRENTIPEVDSLSDESPVGQVRNSASDSVTAIDSSVVSSSDKQVDVRVFSSVSSSSESKTENETVVESTQVNETGGVTSSGNVTTESSVSGNVHPESAVTESDIVDSSDRFEITVEAELVNVSDSGYPFTDTAVSSLEASESCVKQENELSSTSSFHEESVAFSHEDDTSRCDSIVTTTPSEPSASPADSEPTTITTPTDQEAEPAQPTKKKVSLLEYRKRLKEKTPTSTCSSSSSSRPSSTSSLSPSFHVHSRLSSLPSLPLFDSSSPTKDPHNHRHFKSSSDLIRRKSVDPPKREKPLSLTERLKKEFGFEDSEEETAKEARSKVGHQSVNPEIDTPPPPPPRGFSTKPNEAPPDPPPPPQASNFKPPAGFTAPAVQPPQIPHSMHGEVNHRLQSPVMMQGPVPTMVPPPSHGPHNAGMMMPAPGNLPIRPPVQVPNGPIQIMNAPIGPAPMGNTTITGSVPPAIGNSTLSGPPPLIGNHTASSSSQNIPSLMSLPTFNRNGPNQASKLGLHQNGTHDHTPYSGQSGAGQQSSYNLQQPAQGFSQIGAQNAPGIQQQQSQFPPPPMGGQQSYVQQPPIQHGQQPFPQSGQVSYPQQPLNQQGQQQFVQQPPGQHGQTYTQQPHGKQQYTQQPPGQQGQPYSQQPPVQQVQQYTQSQQPFHQQFSQQQPGQHYMSSSHQTSANGPSTSQHFQSPVQQGLANGSQYMSSSANSQNSYQGQTYNHHTNGGSNFNSNYGQHSVSPSFQQPQTNGVQVRDYNHGYENSHETSSEQQCHYNQSPMSYHSPKNYHHSPKGYHSSSHRKKSKKSKHRKSRDSRSYSDYH